MRIASFYLLFACVATAVNIAAQDLSLWALPPAYQLPGSIAVGTAAGLVVKYYLDKTYIFRFQTTDALHDTRTFALYAVAGLLTTTIFWGTEWLFHSLFQDKHLRYVGAVIGLAIGYVIKYRLDKRFVFKGQPA